MLLIYYEALHTLTVCLLIHLSVACQNSSSKHFVWFLCFPLLLFKRDSLLNPLLGIPVISPRNVSDIWRLLCVHESHGCRCWMWRCARCIWACETGCGACHV